MTVLGTDLSGEHHEFLGAVPVVVLVHDELEADVSDVVQSEVRDFDRSVLHAG